MTRYLWSSVLVAICVSVVQGDILEKVLVKVNGDIISKTGLEDRQVAYLREQNFSFDPNDLSSEVQLREALAEATPLIIYLMVDELLIMQHGKGLGYAMGDEQFAEILENIKTENNISSDADFDLALRQEGMTRADLRAVLERQYLVNAVQQVEVLQKISITEVEAREYYDANLDEFTEPAAVSLREVLINLPTGSAGSSLSEAETQKRAESVRERILAGEDFATVASEVSDAPSRANGGLIGPLRRDELSESILSLIEPLQVGEVTDVMRTPQGFQLLKLESSVEASPQPFEDVRSSISNSVFSDRRQAEYDSLLQRLRNEAIIDWKDESLKQAYDHQLAAANPASEGP